MSLKQVVTAPLRHAPQHVRVPTYPADDHYKLMPCGTLKRTLTTHWPEVPIIGQHLQLGFHR